MAKGVAEIKLPNRIGHEISHTTVEPLWAAWYLWSPSPAFHSSHLPSHHYGDPGIQIYLFHAEGRPVLSNPRRHLCLSGCTRNDTPRTTKVSCLFPLISFRVASPVGRVTTFSLIYVHNLRLPLFAQYDMPEKYDLARECITPLIAESC